MKQVFLFIAALILQLATVQSDEGHRFSIQPNLAQYQGSDYSNLIRVERGISLDHAFAIAKNDPQIDYFVYLKGEQMVLEVPSGMKVDASSDPFGLISHVQFIRDAGDEGEGACRLFRHGDTLFFKKEGIWLGSAPGLADTYFKETSFTH